MSGGVDSSVAALLLAREGLSVTGFTMDIWCPAGELDGTRAQGCCGAQSAQDAAAVCDRLGIPHYVLNFRRAFEQHVIRPFVEAYAAGRTPNPCLDCNRAIKWGALLRGVRAYGADALATGHYARIAIGGGDLPVLQRASDHSKDQSYALYMLTVPDLAQTRFPIGDLAKTEVRRLAAEADLPVAERAESQEICFIPSDDYRRLVRERAPEALRPGPIVDVAGNVLGEHQGLAGYTIGQRKGLGLAGGPWFVVALDPERNAVVVGPEEEVFASEITLSDVHLNVMPLSWIGFHADVMTRYRGPMTRALVMPRPDRAAAVRFEQPHRAPAPGQAAVFYQEDTVVGGGTITEVARPVLP